MFRRLLDEYTAHEQLRIHNRSINTGRKKAAPLHFANVSRPAMLGVPTALGNNPLTYIAFGNTFKDTTGGTLMGKLSNIIPVSDLRQDAANILKKLKQNKEPLIITQRGRATAVMIDVQTYEKSEHEKEILRLLAKGEREIEAGDGYDLDSVLAEADLLLTREPS